MLWEKLLWRLCLQWIRDSSLTWPLWARTLGVRPDDRGAQSRRWGANLCWKDNQVDLGGGHNQYLGLQGLGVLERRLGKQGRQGAESNARGVSTYLLVRSCENRTGFNQKLIGIYPGPKQKRNRETQHLKMKWSGQKKYKKFSSKTERLEEMGSGLLWENAWRGLNITRTWS